ncbi:unnamed protein product, partial [Allacma fusca]
GKQVVPELIQLGQGKTQANLHSGLSGNHSERFQIIWQLIQPQNIMFAEQPRPRFQLIWYALQ